MSAVFWAVTLCILETAPRFGGETGGKLSELGLSYVSAGLFLGLLLDLQNGGDMFL
jgi:hypothetical protein